MSMKHGLWKLLRRVGIEAVRYPFHDAMVRTVRLLKHHRVDCVGEVGANDDGFASRIRGLGSSGRIISFEPLGGPFESLQDKESEDGCWGELEFSVGDTDARVTINVAVNARQSSFVLPMFEARMDVSSSSRYVGIDRVNRQTPNGILPQVGIGTRTLLKGDVQGYDGVVRDGRRHVCEMIGHGPPVSTNADSALRQYDDLSRGMDGAEGLAMSLMGLSPVFPGFKAGSLIQADAVYFGK